MTKTMCTNTLADEPPGKGPLPSEEAFLTNFVVKTHATIEPERTISCAMNIRIVDSCSPPNETDFRVFVIELGEGGESTFDEGVGGGFKEPTAGAGREGGLSLSAGCLAGILAISFVPASCCTFSCKPSTKPISPRFAGKGPAWGRLSDSTIVVLEDD